MHKITALVAIVALGQVYAGIFDRITGGDIRRTGGRRRGRTFRREPQSFNSFPQQSFNQFRGFSPNSVQSFFDNRPQSFQSFGKNTFNHLPVPGGFSNQIRSPFGVGPRPVAPRGGFGAASGFGGGFGGGYGGTANQKVAACCRQNPLIPQGCHQLCNFDTFSVAKAYSLYRNGQCPISAAGPFKQCASRDKDHSACCSAGGVAPFCLLFCRPGTPQVSIRHMRCLKYIDTAKQCFRKYLESVPN